MTTRPTLSLGEGSLERRFAFGRSHDSESVEQIDAHGYGQSARVAEVSLAVLAEMDVPSHERSSLRQRVYEAAWSPDFARPCGLRWPEIALEVRVITVAEAFDGLLQPRPEEHGFRSTRSAISELSRHEDDRFDPTVLQALETARRKGRLDMAAALALGKSGFRSDRELALRYFATAFAATEERSARLEIALQGARLLGALESNQDAIEILELALPEVSSNVDRARLLVEMGRALNRGADETGALRVLMEADRLNDGKVGRCVGESLPMIHAQIAVELGTVHARAGARTEAIGYLQRARGMYAAVLSLAPGSSLANSAFERQRQRRLKVELAEIEFRLGKVQWRAGNAPAARLYVDQALRAQELQNDLSGRAASELLLGKMSHLQGQPEVAETWIERSVELYEFLGEPHGFRAALCERALLAVRLSEQSPSTARTTQAKRWVAAAAAAARAGTVEEKTAAHLLEATVAFHGGDPGIARDAAKTVLESRAGSTILKIRALGLLALVEASEHRFAQADARFAAQRDLLEREDAPWEELEWTVRRALVLQQAAQGDSACLEKIRRCFEEIRGLRRRLGSTWLDGWMCDCGLDSSKENGEKQ